MNNKYISYSASIFVAFLTPVALVAGNNLPNGKPFQQLSALIEANEAGIDENSTAILNLNDALSALDDDVSGLVTRVLTLENDFTTLEGTVSDNADDIMQLGLDITSVELLISNFENQTAADIQALKSELELKITEAKSIAGANKSALIIVNNTLTQMAQDNGVVAGNLTTLMGDFAALVGGASESIPVLLGQISTLSNQLTTLNASYIQSQALYTVVKADVAAHHTKIAELEGIVSGLVLRVAILEPFHETAPEPIPALTFTTTPGEAVNRVEQIQQFFIANITMHKYVYVAINTPALLQSMQTCVLTSTYNSYFAPWRNLTDNFEYMITGGSHSQGNYNQGGWVDQIWRVAIQRYGTAPSTRIRLMMNAWDGLIGSIALEHNYGTGKTSYFNIGVGYSNNYVTHMTFKIADDRIVACGY
ncbi:hypothetical protein [Psychromonas hadalis]|uniref:hypothetical protein n=1 Tax=Psychromonas hadalis TaxID=211669 RepID=UPI0003B550E3|nr:hypothetical protein [Psychromonas hadalis]